MGKGTIITDKDYIAPKVGDPKPINEHAPPAIHAYTSKEIKFLDTYVETLDYKEATKASGLSITQVKKNKYLANELLMLQRIMQKKHRLKMAGAKHMDLMEKVESVFDKSVADDDLKTAVGTASTLARMSEAAMRASGEFKDEREVGGMQMQVNINIGSEEKTQKHEGITIEVDTNDKD